MRCTAYLISWITSPLCLLALRIVAGGNKLADIVISPRNSDAGASLNQSGPGTCRRHRRLVGTSLCSPRLSVPRPGKGGSQWSSYSFFLMSILNPFFNPYPFSIASSLFLPCLFSIISCLISILCHLFPPHSFQEYMSNLNNSCLFSILTYV